MELTQLRHFLAVAEHENFTRAAVELAVTQPALSRSVAKLEAELGQPLFERQTRRVRLTDAGRLFESRAREILALVDDAKAELTDDGQTGRLRVGAIPTIAPYFLPGVLRLFRDLHPRAQVVASEETTDRLLEHCRQGELDVVLLAAPVAAPHLHVETLFTEEMLLVLPPGDPLEKQPRITLADLRQRPFVLLDETHCLSGMIEALCRQRAFQPIVVERASQLATVEELVALGHGVSLIPRMARAVDDTRRRVYRSVTNPKPSRTIVLVTNPDRYHSRLMTRFCACVREAAAQFAGR